MIDSGVEVKRAVLTLRTGSKAVESRAGSVCCATGGAEAKVHDCSTGKTNKQAGTWLPENI